MTKIAIVFTSLKYTISNSGIIFNKFKLNQIRKNNKSYSIKVTFLSNLRATYSWCYEVAWKTGLTLLGNAEWHPTNLTKSIYLYYFYQSPNVYQLMTVKKNYFFKSYTNYHDILGLRKAWEGASSRILSQSYMYK